MPRRGMSSMPRRPSAPPPMPRSAPAPPPPAAVPRQPGMFKQMAATAAGVAVGSAVGHTIGDAMTRGGDGGGGSVPQQQDYAGYPAPAQIPPAQQQQQVYNPCQREMQQFLDCAQGHSDISICAGFNEALRQCKQYYGHLMPNTGNSNGKV